MPFRSLTFLTNHIALFFTASNSSIEVVSAKLCICASAYSSIGRHKLVYARSLADSVFDSPKSILASYMVAKLDI